MGTIDKQFDDSEKELQKIEKALEKEQELKSYDGYDKVVHIKDKIEEIEKDREERGKLFTAKTDIEGIDEIMEGGFREGQLIVFSGPTKNGKSQFSRTLTENFSNNNVKCLWFPYEETYEEMLERYSGVADFYVPKYMDSGNIDWIQERIVEAKVKYGTQVIFIDHLDFLKDESVTRQANINMSSYIGGIVRRLKETARDQRVTVFLMVHILKSNWTKNELPKTEDIRDSGQIPQLADIVMMIRRKRDENDSSVYLDESEIGIIENRMNGKTGKHTVYFENGKFTSKSSHNINIEDIPM